MKRSSLPIHSTVRLIEQSYEGWNRTHYLRYLVPKPSAGQLLTTKFAVGSPVVINRQTLLITNAKIEANAADAGFGMILSVEARTVGDILATTLGHQDSPPQQNDTPIDPARLAAPAARKIIM